MQEVAIYLFVEGMQTDFTNRKVLTRNYFPADGLFYTYMATLKLPLRATYTVVTGTG